MGIALGLFIPHTNETNQLRNVDMVRRILHTMNELEFAICITISASLQQQLLPAKI